MQNTDIRRNIEHLRQSLADNGYSKGRILQFNSTTNQLLKFMAQHEINKYSMDVGMRFIGEKYGFRADGTLSHVNQGYAAKMGGAWRRSDRDAPSAFCFYGA